MKEWTTQRAKAEAHSQVKQAIAKGELMPQPCETCGYSITVHAHHDDYRDSLNVRWLCPFHHKAQHKVISYAKKEQKRDIEYASSLIKQMGL